MKRDFAAPGLDAGLRGARGSGLAGKKFEPDIEPVKVIGAEGGLEDPANLVVIANGFEFLSGSTDGEVVDNNLALLEGALGYAAQLAQLEIAEALHSNPDANSKHGQNKAERTAGGPKQKQAEESEHGRDSVEHNHDLAMGEAMLQELVMDVLAVGGKDGASADQAADDGERGFKNRQAEGDNGNCDCDDGGGFLRSGQSECAEHESNEETAGVSQENGRWVEVIAQKAEDRAGQRHGHHGD